MKYLGRFIGVALLGGIVAASVWTIAALRNLPSPELIASPRIRESTKIYDRTGEVILYELYGEERRTVLPPEEIPDVLRKATIAIEDENFYRHGALDFRAVIRAFLSNVTKGRIAEGGSTITQQLAKMLFLRPERTLTRKLQELALAIRLERQFLKDEILNLYLNNAPYGSNAYGVETASRTYFGKNAADLTAAEAALLAALTRAPSYYSPYGSHTDALWARQNAVLRRMNEQGYLTDEETEGARGETPQILSPRAVIRAPHFAIAVQEYLHAAYGEDFVRTAGLSVITTLDVPFQELAERVVAEGAARNEELYKGTNAALVAEDPKSGEILALVGSRDYFDAERGGNFNVALQGLRQPGSALKPFVYLVAFERGFTPAMALWDVETEFDATGVPERSYKPVNFDELFRGPIAARDALAQSVNIPAIKMLYFAGIDRVLERLKDFGITTLGERTRYGLSLVLGGGEVHLQELIHAYAALAGDGVQPAAHMIKRISYRDERGRERALEGASAERREVISPRYARVVNDILSDPSLRASLFKASLSLTVFPGHDVALKTGTSDDFRDAWAVGYTPSLVVGVWAGNNDNAPMIRRGGSILAAVPIWSAFLREALASTTAAAFPAPEPLPAANPYLSGNYLSDGLRSELHYLSKNNPQGPKPITPERDSQFKNWEEGVARFLEAHPNFLTNPPAIGGTSSNEGIVIALETPPNGSFVGDAFMVRGTVTSPEPLTGLELLVNGALIESRTVADGGAAYRFEAVVRPQKLELQNLLTLKARASSGAITEKNVVFYRLTP